MKRMTSIFVVLAATSFAVSFSGCGQSGALYIPGNPSQMAVPPEDASDSEDEQQEKPDPSTTE